MHIATSPLTGRIHAGKVNRTGTAFIGNKTDVTSDVLKAVIDKAEYHGGSFEIEGGGKKWTVTVASTPHLETAMTDHNTYRTTLPTCPHCGHELNVDEMNYGASVCEDDLWALAPNEGRSVVVCPLCDKQYWVQGGYQPHYTSAFSEEDL